MRQRSNAWLWLAAALALLPRPAYAHVGSKDVFEQVHAGPYRLFVTIRPPVVIPGVATVEARSTGAVVNSIEIAPVPLTGEAAMHPPTPDAMRRSGDDPTFFTGSLWLMASGSWQVRLALDGSAGRAVTGVPVPAMPLSVLRMQRPLGALLAFLGLLLVLGMTGIVAAAVRESTLAPGETAPPRRRRFARLAGAAALALLVAAAALGDRWWKVEAAGYAADIYHPTDLHAALNGDTLQLELGGFDPEKKRWVADPPSELLLDHEHLMHLYAIRWPQMDAAFHLHPQPVAAADGLSENLPKMPPGVYRLYADIVHRNGFPETLTATLTVPDGLRPAPQSPEDAAAAPPPLSAGELGASYRLPDGYTMVWDRPASVKAATGYLFRFRLLDPAGAPATDMQPYLGMAGHAAWVKTDGTVFAHTHPEGSAAMPAMEIAAQNNAAAAGAMPAMGADDGSGMADMPGMSDEPISATVEFPYGFPSAGRYRVFVQMKHGGMVETGVFDTEVQ